MPTPIAAKLVNVAFAATRKTRCRILTRSTFDRCANEALSDYGMCLTHLAGAAGEFEALLTEARQRLPRLAAATAGGGER